MTASPSAGQRPVLVLAGPTATGKTELAMALADRRPVQLISVDSAMVYRGMDIGTAKPSAALRAAYPHALVDIRDPADGYSVEQFCSDARAAIGAAWEQGRLPLLVGGTMLYFRALLDGLSALPGADPQVRARLEGEARQHGNAALYARLQAVDPAAAARIHPNNPQRVQRALEIYEVSGRTQSDWWRAGRRPGLAAALDADVRVMVLEAADRARLHQSIDQRLTAMLAAGFVDEVRGLRQRTDLHADLPALRAVGYRQVWHWLDHDEGGGVALLREQVLAATRQLARRQCTWLRRLPRVATLPVGEAGLVGRVLQSLGTVPIFP